MPVAVVVVSAAALHAAWNAMVKPAVDRLALMAVMGAASAAVCIPIALFVNAPRRAAWPELAASAVLHVLYSLLLIAAYRDADFNQVYPLARGTSPPTVAVCAALFVGESLSSEQIIGLLAVSAGLFALAAGRRRGGRRTLAFALLTGLAIAAYTVVDGVGVRRSGSALSYTAWLFSADGLMIFVVWLSARARTTRSSSWPRALIRPGGLAGILSLLAYGLVLWAQTRGALAVVAGLRETSVVFAAAIGAVIFKEPLGWGRVLASVVIAAGAVLLSLG